MALAVFACGLLVSTGRLEASAELLLSSVRLHLTTGNSCSATDSNFTGSGLGSLETAANPYIAVCGPPRYSELRINLAQAVNAIGTVLGPTLGSYVFFKDTTDSVSALKNVQWVYLAIGLFVFVLAVFFYVVEIPEITDADMELQAQVTHEGKEDKPFHKQYVSTAHGLWKEG